jgi:hypothetical protein
MYIIATVLVAFPALVVGQQQPATASPSGPITPSYQYDMYRNSLPTCFDYRAAFEISKGECNLTTLFNHIRAVYEEQSKENWALKWGCHGGLTRELMTLTGVDDHSKWRAALEGVCEGAFERVAVENIEQDGSQRPGIDLEDYFQGSTVLNYELGMVVPTDTITSVKIHAKMTTSPPPKNRIRGVWRSKTFILKRKPSS